ncbi:hypothetical protein K439DRAFT_1296790, partial [Ramaria rubella]
PLPFVPESELNNFAAQRTISQNPELFKIVSPINVRRFEELLLTHPNRLLVNSVCRSLREGVWPYANPHPDALETLDCSDRQLDEKGIVFARAQRDAEIAEDCFSHAFGPDLLPGMYSTPIGVLPKPNTDKLHLVNDQSTGPHAPNSWVLKADTHIRLDNLQDFGVTLR